MPRPAPAPPAIRRLTVAEVAQRLRVHVRTVKRWIREGVLVGIDVTRAAHSQRPRYVVDERDLLEFERQRTVQGPAPKVQRRRRQPEPGVIQFFKET